MHRPGGSESYDRAYDLQFPVREDQERPLAATPHVGRVRQLFSTVSPVVLRAL